jgi:hypothetical protein
LPDDEPVGECGACGEYPVITYRMGKRLMTVECKCIRGSADCFYIVDPTAANLLEQWQKSEQRRRMTDE